jgi:hypothetical protein
MFQVFSIPKSLNGTSINDVTRSFFEGEGRSALGFYDDSTRTLVIKNFVIKTQQLDRRVKKYPKSRGFIYGRSLTWMPSCEAKK